MLISMSLGEGVLNAPPASSDACCDPLVVRDERVFLCPDGELGPANGDGLFLVKLA